MNFTKMSLSAMICFVYFLLASGSAMGYVNSCGYAEHEACVRMADPLLTDAHMIFPDNMVDIDRVCRRWTLFVDCIRKYIEKCFTDHNRQQFNQAVEIPVDSIHQMCTSSAYQTEYLQHATCLKDTLTDDRYCGRHYRHLAAQVQNNRDMAKDDLCCSHHRFRECVLSETRRVCDKKLTTSSKMLPSAFSRQVLDKALGFLKEQCSEYTPNPGECIGYQQNPPRIDQSDDDLTDSMHIIGPTYSVNGQTLSVPSNVDSTKSDTEVDSSPTLNPLTWIPSRDGRRRTTSLETESTADEQSTRSSYGRGVTWEPTLARDDPFKATHYKPSTEAWYPANNINFNQKEVEDFNTNDVEEPNQQGLAHFDADSGATTISAAASLAVTLIVVGELLRR